MQIISLDDNEICANDMLLAKDMADTLNAHYPGHMWGVGVDGSKGVAHIRNFGLSAQHGYTLRLVDNFSASDYKQRVLMAGGEILERYSMRRGALTPEDLSMLPTDFAGRIIGDTAR